MEKFPALGIITIACIAKLIWVWSHQMTYLDAPKSLLPELEVANDTFCDELFGSCTVMGEFFKVRRVILKLGVCSFSKYVFPALNYSITKNSQ